MFPLKYLFLSIIIGLFCLTTIPLSGQIIFKNLPQNDLTVQDSIFFDLSASRKILLLHGDWSVYQDNSDKSQKVKIKIPSVFEGEADLVFEKSFPLSESDISNYKLKLNFLGINYAADISLNNISIYRHTGGEFPFSLDLPKDILRSDKQNILSVRLSNKSHSKNTIPVKQKFHFPKSLGGVFRDVYIHFTPNIFVSDLSCNSSYDGKTKKYFLSTQIKIENKELAVAEDISLVTESFLLKLYLHSPNSDGQGFGEIKFQLPRGKEIFLSHTFELSVPAFWSPINPQEYYLTAEIFSSTNLIDATSRTIPLYNLEFASNSLLLNNQPFNISGVTYFPVYEDYGGLMAYSQMEKDIKLIKATGFNAIRFAKKVPHPYYLKLCEKYGLLPFIEVPINSIPASILTREDFKNRAANYVSFFTKAYKDFLVGGVGLGGSYSGNSEADKNFIQNLAGIVKKNTNWLLYASFKDGELKVIPGLDFYGVELINESPNTSKLNELISNGQFEAGKIFISEASYLVSRGKSDGYLNENSYEAQAKYFEDVLDFSKNNSLFGYFLNSIFDYRSDYASIVAGYNENNLLHVGLAEEDRGTDRLAYKVIYAKLNNSEKVTIPIGSKKDDSPMIFIITGILIAIVMGIMINSGKKFREDSTRALLRPYNFFADVRDQRLISGAHTFILVIIIAATSGLLLSNILYYLKESILFEKIILSFGSSKLIHNISYISWNPLASIWWLSLLTIIALAVLIIIVKAASAFVKTRVAFSSVFHTVIWSFLPVVILLPLGIILYRVLSTGAINIHIFIAMLTLTIWVFYRLMKGIYVIYDTNPANVYLYSIIILFIIATACVIYFEISESAFTYIMHSLKDYKILG